MVPSLHPEPPLPVLPNDDDPGVMSRISPLRVADDSPILDVFPSYPFRLIAPSMSRPPPRSRRLCGRMLTIGHHIVRPQWTSACRLQVICYLGIRRNYPLLMRPLTPRPTVDDVGTESSVGSPIGEPVVVPSCVMSDLSQEGPFDVHQDALELGRSPPFMLCQNAHNSSRRTVISVRGGILSV